MLEGPFATDRTDGAQDQTVPQRAVERIGSERMRWFSRFVAAIAVGYSAVGLWLRNHPDALPYAARFFLLLPRRTLHWRRLITVLAPAEGERVLEVGPGMGYYSLPVASCLDGGTLEVLDVRQAFLDNVTRRARQAGIANVRPTLGDGKALPYEDSSFDAAFLIVVIGEIPDQVAALRELFRVLRPGGRLVIGESIAGGDPHHVWFGALRSRAELAGFRFAGRFGGSLAYFARFLKP